MTPVLGNDPRYNRSKWWGVWVSEILNKGTGERSDKEEKNLFIMKPGGLGTSGSNKDRSPTV